MRLHPVPLSMMKNGWFIGNFKPSVLQTESFEVGYLRFEKDSVHTVHTHKIATEYNLITKGKMQIQGRILSSGDIFVLYPYEIADPVYLEDTEIVCIKVPSVPDDKHEVIIR